MFKRLNRGLCSSLYKYRILVSIGSLLVLVVALTLYSLRRSTKIHFIRWNMTENISCHYKHDEDALPVVDSNFFPPSNSIFFHETSCRGGLTSRQACAVESAARVHRGWQVHVLFSGPVSDFVLKNTPLVKLLEYDNIKMLRINMKEYAIGTPLEDMMTKAPYQRSKWRIEHSSDALRYLTLYKYGGVYMDTDVVVVRSFDSLAKNWAARESAAYVAAGAMAFSRDPLGRKVAVNAIKEFKKSYKPNVWGNNGPGVISRVLKQMCSKKWNLGCNGFQVYEPAMFYPVNFKKNKVYFLKNAKLPNVNKTYVHHLWNKLSHNHVVAKDSPYDKLAKEYCPKTYNVYGDLFGTI